MLTTNLQRTLGVAKVFLALNGMGAFFFDFVQIGTADRNITLQGFDLVFGRAHLETIEFSPNFWTILLLIACALQVLATMCRQKIAIWWIVFAAIFILVMMQLDFLKLWRAEGVSVQFGYWLALCVVFAIALCHAIDVNLEIKSKTNKQHLHINIFTERESE